MSMSSIGRKNDVDRLESSFITPQLPQSISNTNVGIMLD